MRIRSLVPTLVVTPCFVVWACGGDSGPSAPSPLDEGSLSVTTRTTGQDLDLSAYVVTAGQERRRIERNGAATITPLPTGGTSVRLEDVAANCSVAGGPSRQVTVAAGEVTSVAFDVDCAAVPPAEVDVTGTWTGPSLTSSTGESYAIAYVLTQTGDDVTAPTISYKNLADGSTSTFSGAGRVSGHTLTLFFLGSVRDGDQDRVTASLEVSGDEMTGRHEEQLGRWSATMTLQRPSTQPQLGVVRVMTRSMGDDLDLSAYVIATEDERRRIELNDTVEFADVVPGTFRVELDDVADNCAVTGGAVREIEVTAGDTSLVAFEVSCGALPPAEVNVTGTWIGITDWTSKGETVTITYVLEQTGDDVTASTLQYHNEELGVTNTFSGIGRVYGHTLTIFYLGVGTPVGTSKVIGTFQVGDQMSGEEVEQLGYWGARVTLTRQ